MIQKLLKPYWLLLLAISCERGCTCSHDRTLETESETRTVDEVQFEMTAKHIRTKTATVNWNLRCTEGNHYWVGFDLKFPKRPPAINILTLPTGESIDLKTYLPMCEVRFSPEKRHFVVLYKQKMNKLYHLLPAGTPFSYTPFPPDSLKLETNFWTRIPPADSVAVQMIRGNIVFDSEDAKLLQQSLSEQPIGNFYDLYLVSFFPQNSFAVQLFGRERTEKLAKNAEWKEGIIKRTIRSIESKEYNLEASQMVLYLSDNEVFTQIDPIMLERWTAETYAHSYLIERLKDKNKPLPKDLEKRLQEQANRGLEKQEISYLDRSYEILRFLKDESRMEKSLLRMLENDFYTQNPFLVKDILESNYAFFSTKLKNTVVAKSKSLMEVVPELLHKQFLLEFLKDKITCSEFWSYQDRFFGQEEALRVLPPEACEK